MNRIALLGSLHVVRVHTGTEQSRHGRTDRSDTCCEWRRWVSGWQPMVGVFWAVLVVCIFIAVLSN